MHEAALAQTLDAIYDASVDRDRWPAALVGLARLLDCTVASLIERDLRGGRARSTTIGIDAASEREFIDVWGTRNVFIDRTRHWRSGAIEPDQAIMPKADLLASDYYNGFMKPHDMHALLRVSLHIDGAQQQFLSLVRPRRAGEFEAADVERFAPLLGHLQRATRIARHFDETQLMLGAVAEVLEQNSSAVLLVDQAGKVVFANHAARVLAQSGDSFTLRQDRLALPDTRNDALLQRLLSSAARRLPDAADADLAARGGVMRLPRGAQQGDLIAVVAPLAPDLAWSGGAPMALLAISDPQAAVQPPQLMLRELFGLSIAETRVALAVMQGDSPAQIAARLGIKLTTTRWHLAAVFRKTGTTRQAELLRLLLSLPTSLNRLPN